MKYFVIIRNLIFILFFLGVLQIHPMPVYALYAPTNTPTNTPIPPTSCSGTCRNVCGNNEMEAADNGTCPVVCCVAAPTCASVGGECRGTCTTTQQPGGGYCANSSYTCCVQKPPVTPTCTGGTCMTPGCAAGYVSHGDCNTTGYVCCEAAVCPGLCRATCLATETDLGFTCSGGGKCCQWLPSGSTSITCYFNSGCGVLGCSPWQAWVQEKACVATWVAAKGRYQNCNEVDQGGCTNTGGVCVNTNNCTGCHPSSCTTTCGLGGCPGGCGSVDDCGGVDCNTAGCVGGTPSCGDGTCSASESCSDCAADCGSCPNTPTSTPPGVGCNDGVCTPPENCSNCNADCGACPSGVARVIAKVVDNSATTCAEVSASTTTVATTVGISPNVSPGDQVVSGGNYGQWTVPGNLTYYMQPVSPGGFALKLACWDSGTGLSAFIGDTQTITWQLGYTIGTPWFQASGGDVYATTILSSPIGFDTDPRYFSLNGPGGTPGFVTYGSSYDFDSETGSSGDTLISPKGWLLNDAYTSTDYYAVMYHRFGSPTTEDYVPGATINSKPATKATPYYVNGDLTIDGAAWNVPSGENIVFLVNGNLTIKQRINIVSGGFVAFIVNGNILIHTSVGTTSTPPVTPVVEGIYITSPTGTFHTGVSTTPAARRFVGKGSFVAGSFAMERDLDADATNNVYSSELFIYNPELLIHMPEEMKDVPVTWEEVAP